MGVKATEKLVQERKPRLKADYLGATSDHVGLVMTIRW